MKKIRDEKSSMTEVHKKRIEYNLADKAHRGGIASLGLALSSPVRVEMLSLINSRPYTVMELERKLYVSASSVLFHANLLQEAGLARIDQIVKGKVTTRMISGNLVSAYLDFTIGQRDEEIEWVTRVRDVAVGSFVACGGYSRIGMIAKDGSTIGEPYDSRRTESVIVWLDKGWIEYRMPVRFCSDLDVSELNFTLEICSEAPFYRNDWKSDITFSLNGAELCTYTSPQDFGERRGLLNPTWWLDTHTQYGQLIRVSVTKKGVFLNGEKASDLTLSKLPAGEKDSLLFRIENKPDAKNVGGFNLFSRYMGDYDQDIRLSVVGSKRL